MERCVFKTAEIERIMWELHGMLNLTIQEEARPSMDELMAMNRSMHMRQKVQTKSTTLCGRYRKLSSQL